MLDRVKFVRVFLREDFILKHSNVLPVVDQSGVNVELFKPTRNIEGGGVFQKIFLH